MCAVIACVLLGVRPRNFVGRCNYERTFRDNSYLYQLDPSFWTGDVWMTPRGQIVGF